MWLLPGKLLIANSKVNIHEPSIYLENYRVNVNTLWSQLMEWKGVTVFKIACTDCWSRVLIAWTCVCLPVEIWCFSKNINLFKNKALFICIYFLLLKYEKCWIQTSRFYIEYKFSGCVGKEQKYPSQYILYCIETNLSSLNKGFLSSLLWMAVVYEVQ